MTDIITIDFGRVTASTILADIGKDLFFITYIDLDGGEWGLGSCADYGAAIELAETSRRDFDLSHAVVDRVLGRGAE
jgi:hypothetical protein